MQIYCFVTGRLWNACKVAALKGVPFHIVDRAVDALTKENDEYYKALGSEFGYSEVNYRSMSGTSLSGNGVQLKKKGELQSKATVPVVLNSVLFT